MNNALKSKIENVQSEVKELHPLLETIFRKMPTIQKTDYTHGPNEKGADFILTKHSEEFGDSDYIGVVVKKGKVKQNFSEISEQIEECTLRRYTTNGKKEITLSEVWLVANGTISNNAKEKIHERYRATKIKFVDLNLLADWTEKYVPDYGVGIPIQDANFLSEQRALSVQREEKYSILPAGSEDVSIQCDIRKIAEDFSKGKKGIDLHKEIETSKFLIVEAQMGGGKTKLLNQLVKHYADIEVYKDKKIVPIYVGSRDLLQEKVTLESLVEGVTSHAKLSDDVDRRYLILVDGIDESRPSGGRISERVVELIEEVDSQGQFILLMASRDISDDIIEANDSFRKNRYQIQPLTLKSMLNFLETLCKEIDVKNRLVEDLKNTDLFKVLPRTPIAAIILAKLLAEGGGELPLNLTELYSKYCELSLGRWDIDKGLKTQRQYEALDAISSELALYIIENSLPGVSKQEAKQIFRGYLVERNLQLDADSLFEELLDRSDIFIEDLSNKTVQFKHRSFGEYYYAKGLMKKQSVPITKNVFHPYWSNAFFFYIGLKRDCPDLLDEVISIPVESEGHRLSRMINLGNFLLAGYQSPYQVIEKGIKCIFVDAGAYYNGILQQSEESVLAKLPPMHLLALFQGVLSRNYEYHFFEKAIIKAIEEAATEPDMLDSTPYTLYFLDSLRFKLGGECLYEKLVDLYGKELPLPLQLAIGGKSDRLSYKSPVIKKLRKQLSKNSQTSPSLKSTINKLYDESIDSSVRRTQDGKRKFKK